ncbi:MAG: DUF5397 family protein [Pseudomonadota bacterium]
MHKLHPEHVKNTFRRFGPYGPVYQIIDVSKLHGNEILMKIHVLETNEALDYPFSSILKDPQE